MALGAHSRSCPLSDAEACTRRAAGWGLSVTLGHFVPPAGVGGCPVPRSTPVAWCTRSLKFSKHCDCIPSPDQHFHRATPPPPPELLLEPGGVDIGFGGHVAVLISKVIFLWIS